MGKVIGICNQKGGVGKTTTVIAMRRALIDMGYKVLLIDVDDSGNPSLTKILGVEEKTNLTDLMMFKCMERDISTELHNAIKHHKEGMDIIPADKELAGITHFLNGIESNEKKRSVLKSVVDMVRNEYDYILLDAAPSLNIMSTNLLIASDEIIVVSQSQGASADGVVELLRNVIEIKEKTKPEIIVKGILITMVDKRTNYNQEKADSMRDVYMDIGFKVFENQIPRAIIAEKYVEKSASIIECDPESKPAKAYVAFTKEYLEEVI